MGRWMLVNKKDLSKVERSQIEDIVVRKVGCRVGDVVISSTKGGGVGESAYGNRWFGFLSG